MGFFYLIAYGKKLLPPCLVYRILKIDSGNRLVGRYLNNIHAVNVTEFLFLGKCRTGHTAFLLKLVKEVLECYRSKRLALTLNLNVFLGLYCLMKSVGIPSSGHYTTCKLINDKNLVILNNIVLITEHKVMRTKCKYYVVLYLNILRIGKVVDLKEFFYLGYTLSRKCYELILFVNDKITRLFSFDTHDGIHLGQVFHVLTAF